MNWMPIEHPTQTFPSSPSNSRERFLAAAIEDPLSAVELPFPQSPPLPPLSPIGLWGGGGGGWRWWWHLQLSPLGSNIQAIPYIYGYKVLLPIWKLWIPIIASIEDVTTPNLLSDAMALGASCLNCMSNEVMKSKLVPHKINVSNIWFVLVDQPFWKWSKFGQKFGGRKREGRGGGDSNRKTKDEENHERISTSGGCGRKLVTIDAPVALVEN